MPAAFDLRRRKENFQLLSKTDICIAWGNDVGSECICVSSTSNRMDL